jgi:hypothetical protein
LGLSRAARWLPQQVCTQMHYARRGEVTEEMVYLPGCLLESKPCLQTMPAVAAS